MKIEGPYEQQVDEAHAVMAPPEEETLPYAGLERRTTHVLPLLGARRRTPLRWIGPALMALCDIALVLVGFAIAYWMRYVVDWPAPLEWIIREVLAQNFVPFHAFFPYMWGLAALLLGLFLMKGLYRLPRHAGLLDHAGIIISSTTIGIAILIVVVFLSTSSVFYSRLIFGFAWVVIVLLLCLWRAMLIGVRRLRWIQGYGRESVLVVGGTGLGRNVMEGIVAQPDLGYALVGYLDDRAPLPEERRNRHFRRLGDVNDLKSLLRTCRIHLVILALPFWEHRRLPELVSMCREAGVDFRVAPDLYHLSFDRVDIGDLGGIPLIGLKELSLTGWNLLIKRMLDIFLVLLAAPFALPIAAVLAVLIKRDSPGPAIFKQKRVGKDGKLFTAYKFRTMVDGADAMKSALAEFNEADGPIFKMKNDPRLTRVGRYLRRASLDELPQLWNILRGEMSWVGPRPPTPDEVTKYAEWHHRRLEVTPGLTGLWQVLGRSDTAFDEMVRLDVYYAENWSIGLDLRIMLQTIPVVLLSKGAY